METRRTDRGGDRRGRLIGALICALVVGGVTGCPTYENSHSGTYREQSPDPTGGAEGRRSVEIDLFRYGDRAKAILRYYAPDIVDGDPYGEQTFCTWTWADRFNEESGEFDLTVRKSSTIPNGRLVGEIQGSDRMEATLYDAEAGEEDWETVQLERTAPDPETDCAGPREFQILATFNLPSEQPNRLPEQTNYEIDNPVLAVQWVGLQRQQTDQSDTVYASVSAQGWTGRLGGRNYDESEESFRGNLSFPLTPPPDKILSSSRATQAQFAVGHLVVVDDSESEGEFRWNVDREPIVASALQSGTLPEAPPQADGSGKAILYVEGSIEDLAESLGNISSTGTTSTSQPRLTGYEEADESELASRNFFLADVSVNFREDLIVQMQVYPQVTTPRIPLQATDRHLGEPFSPLPRLFP